MEVALMRQRMRIDKQKVADLIGVDVSALITLQPKRDYFIWKYTCHHSQQFWLDDGKVNPKWIPPFLVNINVLFDEYDICYGTAGVCPCGKAYFVAPTIQLIEYLDAEVARYQAQQLHS